MEYMELYRNSFLFHAIRFEEWSNGQCIGNGVIETDIMAEASKSNIRFYISSTGNLKISSSSVFEFSDESEAIYQREGLAAFAEHERQNAQKPLPEGPFAKFLKTISFVQRQFSEDTMPIRTALVTARNAPAHERVIRTLRAWDVRIDEAFFLGGIQKSEILKAFGANIFFDDQSVHTEPASKLVPAARVPYKEK